MISKLENSSKVDELFNKEYCNLDYDFESIGGESIDTFKARLKDFIFETKKKYYSKKVLVVAHNGVISMLSCILEGVPEDNNFKNCGIKNGEIKEFKI